MNMTCKPAPLPWLDRAGALWATVCAVHCLVLPLIFVMFPAIWMALYSFSDPRHDIAIGILRLMTLEPWFIAVSAGIVGFAAWRGFVHHRRGLPTMLAVLGIASLSAAYRYGAAWEGVAHLLGMLAGGTLLVSSHYANIRLGRQAAVRDK
jgi:hypothetical protein